MDGQLSILFIRRQSCVMAKKANNPTRKPIVVVVVVVIDGEFDCCESRFCVAIRKKRERERFKLESIFR